MRKQLGLYILLLITISLNSQQTDFTLVVKFHPEQFSNSVKSINDLSDILPSIEKVEGFRKIFPNKKRNKFLKPNQIDLSNIYEINFKSNKDLKLALINLSKSKKVLYAEQMVQNQLFFTPNDSLRTQQYYLDAVKAYDAWDINQGDTSIVIAFVDTGTDLDHPDLVNNLALNLDDPINGIDDDNDGYIDNYYGWNVASNNNNVSFQNQGHGTNVAAIACAEVNNQFGIAGVGYKTRFLTVRNDLPNGFLRNSFEGIVYAADQDADIINCSWGSPNFSQLGQDIINYATYNKGALVVAATGNNGHENKFYPAAYENVLSVGSTIEGDTVKSSSNYGTWVKIMAPGDNMLTCNVIGGFGTNGGTSMAAPVVSACAAIVKAQNPNFNAQQIAQKLITTADNIDALAPSNYAGKLGTGRVNLFRALSENYSPGLEFINRSIYSNNQFFRTGDTIKISGDFVNYLNPTNSAKAIFSCNNSAISFIQNEVSLGQLNSLDTLNNSNSPITFLISNSPNTNENIEIEVEFIDGNYSAKQYFEIAINKDFITVNENLLKTTVASSGGIGFSGVSNELGDGLSFKNGKNLLFEGSFAVGSTETYLLDKFRNNNSSYDNDFQTVAPVKEVTAQKANVEYSARYNDASFSNPQGLEILQWNYLYRTGNGSNSIIYVFSLRNNGFIDLRNLYAGLFMDWDINNAYKNRIYYDTSRNMSVSLATDTNIYCGVTHLSNSYATNHYAIVNAPSSDSIISTFNGFSEEEKYLSLSNNRDSAGFASTTGEDIIDVISAGPFTLKTDSLISIAFAISVSDSLELLEQESDSLKLLFKRLALGIIDHKGTAEARKNSSVYPNPANEVLKASFNLSESSQLSIKIFDINGRIVFEEVNRSYRLGINEVELNTSNLKSGIYFIRINGENLNIENKFIVSGN